jgi:hypothetical protein
MKLKDHIAYLQTLNPELECWFFWDESGECWPCKKYMGSIVYVGEEECGSRGEKRFEFDYKRKARYKKVFMTDLQREEETK